MKMRLLVVVLLGLMVRTAAAQDAKAVLQAAATAMGTANVKSVQYSGTGWNTAMGQNYSPDTDWPRFEVTSYTRTIDYAAPSSKEEIIRRQGSYPGRGGGGTPLQGDQHLVAIVSGKNAWNLQGTEVRPAPETSEVRQIEILLSAHGFIKAAMAAANATAASFTVAGPSEAGMTQNGGRMTIVSFTALGKYRVNGTINAQNMVEMVQTWIPNPVLGDMMYETRSTEYKDFGGAKFPTFLHVHMGNFRLSAGHDYMEIKLTNVQPNVSLAPLAVPDAVRQATVAPVRAESTRLADGVWLIGGGTHNSLAVEFRDFVAVVEAPLNEERSMAVIGEVHKLIPGKTIRYIVNTHHHFDHSGGLRTYVAEGATVVTQQANKDFYQDVVFYPAPRTLQPDRLSTFYPTFVNARKEPIETVSPRQKYVLSDGVRTMDLYPVEGLAHAAGMLMAYLPKEKILVNADLYSPPIAGAQPPASPTPTMVTLQQNIQRLKLDVTQHVPIHGQPGPMDEFLKIVGKPSS
jgi:glyoxylase-like metal-dependent hydrolase (beta-lactamase superfamily II)